MLEYCRLYVGLERPPAQLLGELAAFEYRRVDEVADPGEMAARGGTLDVFPATFESPIRLEFQGNRIASIRSFNPKSFETLGRHSFVVVLPRGVRVRPSLEVPFEAFVDLREGDNAVHLHHGIGRYVRRTTIPGPQGPHEVLELEYAGGDRLYVPVEQVHLVQAYAAFGARRPKLHKLGGAAWEREKAKAYAGAWLYAKTVLDLQARRLALPGYAFPPDADWQALFEEAFPYRETPDQAAAVRDVKRDMEQPRPMDRVLLGDVGYGKTEVALRAAFKAVTAHKQVALLVPTTILAYQHARTVRARVRDFPVRVEVLSRFQSERQQQEALAALSSGACDIVIGTHRLLSPDVRFRDLGLVIVDEEQRFGVKDKEHLKEWRTQVDMLTLSATPIPRTLYLALVGARDLSLIATPPENRHPIRTEIAEDDDEAMRSWIGREVGRGGQIFVVHNRVASIWRVARRIGELMGELRVGVGHGQMHEDELEGVMLAFIEGRLDVLVTTTIIESGIDIPNANTLIVHRAETFGLADLYQLRGRVGRFDRQAYAYLVVPKRRTLTRDARKRLEVLAEHTELGAGFKVAMEDLKIRGAGNLLGVEQSGHITAVGFDLYCRLLRQAVEAITRGAGREEG
ncbi:MAG TPA: DEAD/DEAH box helicase [bacterium]